MRLEQKDGQVYRESAHQTTNVPNVRLPGCPPTLLCSCDGWRTRRRKDLIRHWEALDLIEIGNNEQKFFEQIIVKMQIRTFMMN